MTVANYFGKDLSLSNTPVSALKGVLSEGLFGSIGADKFVSSGRGQLMSGLGGDDTYYVKSDQDRVLESSGGGIDTVIASGVRSHTLAANVENLVIGGNSWGFGNDLDNVIEGKNGAQVLEGGRGDDVLTGGADADTFVFGRGSGHDRITDFSVTDGDKIRVDGYGLVNFDQVKAAMTQDGSDVILKLSATDAVRITGAHVADFTADSFQLGIDTSKLTQTFAEDFNALSLKDNTTGLGRWSTTFDFGAKEGAKSLASHTLLNNDEQQIYVDPNYAGNAAKGSAGLGLNPFSIHDGVLQITAQKTTADQSAKLFGYEYTSGLLTTETSFAQKYGYFEMRAQLPLGQGVWPAFWLLPEDGTNPLELDVMEAVGGDMAHQTSHFSVDGVKSKESFANFVNNPDDFHTYGMLWTEKELAWYIDGVEVSSMATPADLNRPMYMLVNLAVGGNWAGDATFDSASMNVDYVHAYSVDADATAQTINHSVLAAAAAPAPVSEIVGTGDADVLRGFEGSEVLRGLGGDDELKGGLGDNTFDGGAGSDTVSFVDQKDGVKVSLAVAGPQTVAPGSVDTFISIENLTGSHKDDILVGDGAANVIDGSSGDDIIVGGAGNDTLRGSAGSDMLIGGAGDDLIDGGAGNDTVSYAGASAGVTVNLSISGAQATGGAGSDTLISIENVVGSAFNDVLSGGDKKTNLLDGAAGDDILNGGKGRDVLIGGEGADKLFGGAGADSFVFKAVSESSLAHSDTIMDFNAKEGDSVDLSAIDANTTLGGDQAFNDIGTAGFTRHAGELRHTVDASGSHVYGDVNGDGVADFHIAFAGVASLSVTDFIL